MGDVETGPYTPEAPPTLQQAYRDRSPSVPYGSLQNPIPVPSPLDAYRDEVLRTRRKRRREEERKIFCEKGVQNDLFEEEKKHFATIETNTLNMILDHCQIETATNFLYLPIMTNPPPYTQVQVEKKAIVESIKKIHSIQTDLHQKALKEHEVLKYYNEHPELPNSNVHRIERRSSEILQAAYHNSAIAMKDTLTTLNQMKNDTNCPDFND
jgi:uncharacterized protein (UPF0147 family)